MKYRASTIRKAERAVARATIELRAATAAHAAAITGDHVSATSILKRLKRTDRARDVALLAARHPKFARLAELVVVAEGAQ